jgi:LuxR family maltose regulon positive regulatory protein
MLTWSKERLHYELYAHGQLQKSFRREDEQTWQDWLSEQRSFSFQGQHGHMSVIKEARRRGSGYWYAYRSVGRRTLKRYLGQSARITLAHLEDEARAMASESKESSRTKQVDVRALSQPRENPIPLLEARFSPPHLSSRLVGREHLLKKLDTVFEHQWLLLSASAGSGKTTLLSAWASRSPYPVAWLSLDELDDDPSRFWSAVIAALRTRLPEIGDLALAMAHAPQPPPLTTVLTTLLNEIGACSEQIMLILDDYHVIEDELIQDSMLFLLDRLPPNLHVVIASRVDPPFPLSRWRMRGQMTEIREADIRFTQEEAQTFLLQKMGLSLAEEEIALLEQRTEGWIAGLQLAALSLRAQKNSSAFLQRFSGGQRLIQDYVQEEIVQQQPLPVQRFLLKVCVLSRMNAALCQALTEEPASQELLEALERNNLFVVPLDEQRQWYRLHTLFREVLLTQLEATQPDLIPRLHQRAARWYATQDAIHEALAHALAAKDYAFAASVMERSARQLWMRGGAKMIASRVLLLPDAVLQAHLGFALTAALNLLASTQSQSEQQRAQARALSEQIIARVEQALQQVSEVSLPQEEEQGLHNRIRLLRGLMEMSEAFRTGQMQQLRDVAQQMQPLADGESVAWKWYPLHSLFVSAQVLGDEVRWLPDLLAVKQQAFQEQDQAIAMVAMCWIAAALVYAGKLSLARQECLQVQEMIEQAGGNVSVAAYPAFDLSFLYYVRNQLEEAESSLQVAIQQASRWQAMNLLVWAYASSVGVLLASGKMAEAEQALQQAQRLMHESGFTVYAPDVMAAQVSLWLAQGNLEAASAWVNQSSFDPETHPYTHIAEALALARVYLAQQQYEPCLQLLAPLLSAMERVGRRWNVIHLLAWQVVALDGLGERAQARQVAARLLTLTEPEGYIRVYLDAGEPMRRVLQSLHDTPHDQEITLSAACILYVSTLLATFEQEAQKRAQSVDAAHTNASEPAPRSSSTIQREGYEPLSPQEQRVLSLLIAGRTYAEMARELIVSPNTIKTQVSSIYRKLGVSRRAEASAIAQQLHLL